MNSNCLLKICDFGFARAVEPDPNTAMTLEVVTQYYRAPELLAGCKHYDTAIDMWSVGCIFAELLGRRILFEASTPEAQVCVWREIKMMLLFVFPPLVGHDHRFARDSNERGCGSHHLTFCCEEPSLTNQT